MEPGKKLENFFDCRNHKTISFAEKLEVEVIIEILLDLVPNPAKMIKRTITRSRRFSARMKSYCNLEPFRTETPQIHGCKLYIALREIAVTKTHLNFG